MRLALTQPPWGMEREKRRKIRRGESKAGLLFYGGNQFPPSLPGVSRVRPSPTLGLQRDAGDPLLGCVSTLLSPRPLCLRSSLHNENTHPLHTPLLISALQSVTCPLLVPPTHVHIHRMIWAQEGGSVLGRPHPFATTLCDERGRLQCQRRHSPPPPPPPPCLSGGVQPFNWFHTLIVLRDV